MGNERQENSKRVFDVLSVEDAMDKFIREDATENHETNRLVHVMFKQIRQRNAEIRTKSELFLDQWAFHHGGITKDNFKDAVRAWVKFASRILVTMNRKREDAEFRQMQGALAEFGDDEPFTELPGDEDFERAIVKHQRKLKT